MSDIPEFIGSIKKLLAKKKKKIRAATSIGSVSGLVVTFPLLTHLENIKEAIPLMIIIYAVMLFLYIGIASFINNLKIGDDLFNLYSNLDGRIHWSLTIGSISVVIILVIAKLVSLNIIQLPWAKKSKNP